MKVRKRTYVGIEESSNGEDVVGEKNGNNYGTRARQASGTDTAQELSSRLPEVLEGKKLRT
jgi:hypothetical protein